MSSFTRKSEQEDELPALIDGRYEVERSLGRGGMAQVFRVRCRESGQQLALKRLSGRASGSLAALFELEYQVLASIRHPSVVRAFTFGRDGEHAYYTMELLEGEDLKERAPVTWREACAHLRDAAQALELLHARRLVHRDVSPRNLWRTPSGRVMLIDFGSLAPFGRADHVLGTPPFIAPETLLGQELDQRTDLYALGAVGYFLLTRMHAFPAREPGDLPALWRTPPVPPSRVVAQLARTDLEPVPAELDTLVLALLSPGMLARPSGGAEVIDRIDALIGRPQEAGGMQRDVMRAHLTSIAYVGRKGARRTLRRQLALSRAGRGQSSIIEGEPGSGRSRLLRELALEAHVTDATVLQVRATTSERALGVAHALALQLVRALPRPALEAARPLAATLSVLSPELARALGQSESAAPMTESRVAVQLALGQWFLALARAHPIAVVVDDLERVDEASQSFLVALAEARGNHRMFVVCSVTSVPHESTAAERAFRALSRCVRLPALDEAEVLALMRSTFGKAENVERLAARLWRATHGNVGHVLELCDELMERDVIGYVGGSWLMPQELPTEVLHFSREQALLSRIGRLDERARVLGRALSVNDDSTPLELVRTLTDELDPALFASVRTLLDAGVCVAEGTSLTFAHESVRRALRDELTPALQSRVHCIMGTFLLTRASNALERLQAGVHLLAGDDARAPGLVAQTILHIALHEVDTIKLAALATERVLRLLRARGRPADEQVAALALLARAGYTADRRYAAEYGRDAVAAIGEAVGLPLARKLAPQLGRKEALLAGLNAASTHLAKRADDPRIVSHANSVSLLFSAVGGLAGTSTICLDVPAVRAYAAVLEPFTALGDGHVASFIYDYCLALADTAGDNHAKASHRWRALLARLEGDAAIKGMTDTIRVRFSHGALNALGIIEAQREHEDALRLAERLERLGLLLDRICAAQIRALYYSAQGNVALFERHRAHAEQLAIQQGTSWQIETWAPSAATLIAFRAHDGMALKRASMLLQRLSEDTPSLSRAARRARGAYLAVRGHGVEAVALLEDVLQDEPRDYAGWTRTHCMLASTLNLLGQHQRALEVCKHVFAHSSEEDLHLGGPILIMQREQLVAEAALGEADDAYERLGKLIARHHTTGAALMVGELHDAGITIALLRRDTTGALRHFDEMERYYLSTGLPSLAQHCAHRRRKLGAANADSGEAVNEAFVSSTTLDGSLEAQTSERAIERMLAGGTLSFAERARRALQILAEHTRTRRGHLFLRDTTGELRDAASLHDELLAPEVIAWLHGRFARELDDDDDTQAVDGGMLHATDSTTLTAGTRCYRLLMLSVGSSILGCAVVASDDEVPPHCPAEVLRAVAHELGRLDARTSRGPRAAR